MSLQLPKSFAGFSLFVDGIGYAGKVVEAKPPALKIKTEDLEAGGLSGTVTLDMGYLEKLEFSATVAEFTPELHTVLGKPNLLYSLRAAQGEGGNFEAVVYQMRGPLNELETDAFKRGGQTAIKLAGVVRAFKLSIGGREVWNVDIEAGTRIIGGVDQMAGLRSALGY
ncbi:hypothetical protein GE253_05025 [Niveispirillum sp. SYP-B3756]|uniref:phage major tail tube protein n=1 Tax=Niveispirillum sp. SYP-B3756 TaxID=2662178 RepID=UPI001290FDF9|nr:phage major tail tube protein [Niveispirillum sp. SYP-B3756]MQP64706.1 hypothetical protein [Niveispirillum sp. SYP-B3756]